VYGNTSGIQLINERDDYRSRLDALEGKVGALKGDVGALKGEQNMLQTRVKELTAACQGYLSIRHRFLDTFRRDILEDATARWTSMIQSGNAAAHDGDAVTDASLFETGSRRDKNLMGKVYGLSAEQVLSLSKY